MARWRIAAIVVVVLLVVGGTIWWRTRGRESTDDAQVDGRITQIAARVGGTVIKVAVDNNQAIGQGTVLVQLDPRDFQVAVDRASAELADA
jgi:membrane fusion protein (multidrug efflux system)